MRTLLTIAAIGLCGCISSSTDPCEAPAQEVFATTILDASHGQAVLSTPAAAKECHAVFTARLSYTGDDALDPSLPMPMVDVSANAIGTGGEQPGLIGILTTWRRVEDPDSGEFAWWAEIDGGAKNIDAPAVSYGMFGVLQPATVLPVDYYAEITYLPPPEDEPASARLAPPAAARCRRAR